MTQESIKKVIFEVLEEMGISVYIPIESGNKNDTKLPVDIDIREYIVDSLMFITFIIELENKLELEIPDNLLLFDTLSSLSGFSFLLSEIINQREEGLDEKELEKAKP